jgi:hypothetical protein
MSDTYSVVPVEYAIRELSAPLNRTLLVKPKLFRIVDWTEFDSIVKIIFPLQSKIWTLLYRESCCLFARATSCDDDMGPNSTVGSLFGEGHFCCTITWVLGTK